MSDLDTVGRYLAGSRLGVDAGRVPPAAVAAYQETLANLVWTLKWPDRLTRPELLVTFTANAKVETVSLADKDVIVFDTRLGSVFRKLTAFAMGDPNPQAVVGWGLLELAVALASVGAAWPALSAWHLGTIRNEEADADEVDPRVARSVEIQEHFVLAHEVVHAALRTGAIDQAFRESVEDLVRQCIAAAESVRDQAPVDKVIEAVVKEHIDAINSGSRYFRAGPEAREDLLRMAADTYPFREYVADWVQPRPHLIEEMVCDLIASDLTVNRFVDDPADTQSVIDALSLAFLNHAVVEQLKAYALHHAGRDATMTSLHVIMARSLVWETAAPQVLGRYDPALATDAVHRRFAAASNEFGRKVGYQIHHTVPADLSAGIARVPDPPFVRIADACEVVLENLS